MIQVAILRPLSKELVAADWIDLNTLDGNMIILPHHAEEIVQLAPNQPLTFGLPNGALKSIMIPQGILHIKQNQVSIIIGI